MAPAAARGPTWLPIAPPYACCRTEVASVVKSASRRPL
eukprot:CAMPEP_0174929548 /NCGR_PEP_ID=MMETSP1355-20121228/27577_1 /TAXON_ID=464990 /ORGANISM="Hemiselmis tepida, Strain CCMP443" /LENGTH=37 /DNA_ID= /DNA_START= /DNA_END= /DNA_ORIENTATION=